MVAISLGRKDKSTDARRVLTDMSLTGTRKTYVDTYYVKTTSPQDDEDDVLVATSNINSLDDIPLLRSLGRNAFLREKIAREITAATSASDGLWEVDCSFDSHIEETEPVVRIWWTDEEIQEPIMFDQVTGAPLVNSVGELTILTTTIVLQVLNIRRIEAFFDINTPRLYSNKVNSVPFYNAPAGTAKLKGPTTSPKALDGTLWEEVHYKVQFNFTINPATLELKGWQFHRLNQGTKYKSETQIQIEASTGLKFEPDSHFEVDGDRTTGNLRLDGGKLDPNDAPIWITTNRFQIADLNDLNLGPFAPV